MKTQVTAQPIAINAGTSGVPTMLYNEGPDTLYVDKDSTVSSSLSLAIPPLGFMPWPANSPLWAVSRGLSTVRIVNTSIAPTLNGLPTSARLASVSVFQSSDTSYVHELVETAQYASLRCSFGQTATFDMTKTYYVWFDWYDSDGNYLSTRMYQPGMAYTGKQVVLTVPVEGAFVRTRILAQATGDLSNFVLTGFTNERKTSLTPVWDTGFDALWKATSVYGPNITLMRTGLDFVVWSYGILEDVNFHSVKNRIRISLAFGGAPGATGFAVRTIDGLALTANNTTAATGNRQDFEFLIPTGVQCHLHWYGTPAFLPIVTLTWLD